MKKAILIAGCLLVASTSHALDINIGLWEVQSELAINGKKFELPPEVKAMMESLPAEQKKMYEAEMAKLGHKGNSIRICHNEKTLNNPNTMTEKTSCKMNLKVNNSKKFSGTYNCPEDKTSGEFTVTATSKSAYTVLFTGQDAEGRKISATQKAKFISKNCGNIKPWAP